MYTRHFGVGVLLASFALVGTGFAAESTPGVVEGFKEAGVVSCENATTDMVKFLDAKLESAYLNQWNSNGLDKNSRLTTLASTFSDGTRMATLTVTRVEGGCDVTFTQVVSSVETCTELRETFITDWKYYKQLAGATLYEQADDNRITIALASQSNGCLLVKTGLLFFPDK